MRDSLGNKLPNNAMVVRATEVTQFRNCRLNWYYTSHNGLNLEPKERSSKLRFGTVWHKGLEYYYNPEDPFKLDNFKKGIEDGMESELDDLRSSVGSGIFTSELQGSIEKERELLNQLCTAYDTWAKGAGHNTLDAPEISDREITPVEVEKRLLVPIPTPNGSTSLSWLAVKIDTIVRVGNDLWVMEHKTQSSSSRVDDPSNLPLDIQMTLQVWALKQFVGEDERVQGALYNLTRKQAPGPRVKNPIFGRHIVRRTPQELDIAIKTLYRDTLSMREAIRIPELRYTNPQPWQGYCTWGCPIKSVCINLVRGAEPDYIVENTMQQREKDIWQVLEEELKN